MGSYDISLDFKGKSVKQMERKMLGYIGLIMRRNASKGERFMKHNAPWTDRTTNARNGLFGVFKREGFIFRIIFGHSVDYGIYLEDGTRNMRARPIIRPTLKYIGKMTQVQLNYLLDKLR